MSISSSSSNDNDSFEYEVHNDVTPWRSIDGSFGVTVNGKCITSYSAPRRPEDADKCDECGRDGPHLRCTQESDSIYNGEEDVYIPEEWHCVDCRKKLDKDPVNDDEPYTMPEEPSNAP